MKLPIKQKLLFFFTLFIFLLLSYLNFPTFNTNFDEKIREIFFHIRGEIPTTQKILIVDIDEKSITELGQWPFARSHMAQVLVNLTQAGAGIIGLDIIFSEYDRSSPSFMAKALNIGGNFQDNDALLGAVIEQTPTIVGYYFTNDLDKNEPPQPVTLFSNPNSSHLLNFNHVVTNIPVIQNSSYSSGFFNAFSNDNGKITKMPLMLKYNNNTYASLVFEMITAVTQTQEVNIIENQYAIEGVQLSNMFIPTDKNGFMRINFRGAKKSFTYLSFVDILRGNFNPNDIKEKFILIGSSITTLADLRPTVYDLAMPGVEIHANMIDNILKGDFLYEPLFSKTIDIAIILLLTLFLGTLLLFLSSIRIVLTVLTTSTLLYCSYYYVLFHEGIILNLFYPLLAMILTTLSAFYINYQREHKQKEFIKNKFAKKVSLEVVNELLLNDEDIFNVKEKELTIFFSDIREFTQLSENLHSPKKLITLLNRYLEPMSQVIIQNQGTIDKFIGDSIMAYWNAPCNVQNHADKAVQTALTQLEHLDTLNHTLQDELQLHLAIGIGIHTSKVVVGEMGSIGRSDYSIIGDGVNLASRVEGLTKYFGATIIITEFTKEQLQESYPLKYLAKVVVKGKSEAIKLYEVLTSDAYDYFRAIQNDYELAITLYESQKFHDAKRLFEHINALFPSKIHQLYIQKCNGFMYQPDAKNTLEFIMTEK